MAIEAKPLPTKKKKVLVLISNGGGGHKTAADSIKAGLEGRYEVDIVNIIGNVLHSLDPLNRLTRGRFTGEDLYNFFLKRHHNRTINWMAAHGTKYLTDKSIEKAFDQHLRQSSSLPDLIISVTPFVNFGIACAIQKWEIPFIILPTDLDGSTFLQGFPKRMMHSNLKVSLAYDDVDIRKITFQKTLICEDQLAITGFPVRAACLKNYTEDDIAHIRRKHNLLETHKTLTLVMGALGGNLIFEHTKVLSSFNPRQHNLDIQINICFGHNHSMGAKIRTYLLEQGGRALSPSTLLMPYGLVFHLRGYTPEILELMAASDLILTKTGSCTVNEAIYLKRPVLLDNTHRSTARHLWWESFNIPFVQKHQLGAAFSDPHQLHMLIPSFLKFSSEKKQLELPHFEQNIRKLVHEMIS